MQYLLTVPENKLAKDLFNYIVNSNILEISDLQGENEELPEHVLESIRIGLSQSKRGEVTPHEEVMKEIRAKYLSK